MKILILSCNTGEGHNSAAKALKEYIELRGDMCEIKDALAFWSETGSKVISKGHVFLYRRLPKLFGVGYRFEEKHPPKEYDNSFIYSVAIKACPALNDMFEESDYDAVICTHVFAAMMMTELRLRYRLRMPTYLISTDYTCAPGFSEIVVDKIFIAHEAMLPDYIRNGIDEKLIVASGIPIRQSFFDRFDPLHAKKLLKLPINSRIAMMMCGSMGCGPLEELTETIPPKLPKNTHLVVICGNNRRLYKNLTQYGVPENMTVVGYTNRIALYMDAADLIITKPGGLSTTEAANKHLPMVFIDAVPGCETHNLNFFVSRGYAATRKHEEELSDLVCELLRRPQQLESVKNSLSSEFNSNACETIYETVCKEINDANSRLPQIQA